MFFWHIFATMVTKICHLTAWAVAWAMAFYL